MMNKKVVAIIAVVLVGFISTILYLSMTGRIQMGEELEIKDKAKTIQEEVQAIKNASDKEWTIIQQFEPDSDQETNGASEMYINHFANPSSMVEYLFGTLLLKDIDLFSSAFDTNTVMQDLKQAKTVEGKEELLNEIMNRLSRNGTLVEVNLINTKTSFDHAESDVLLIYEDKTTVNVTIDFSIQRDPHDESNKMYYVSTSAWDLIEQVEKATE